MTGAGGLLLAVAAVASPSPAITFVDTVEVDEPLVRLGDVADLSAIPMSVRDRAAAVVVARAPRRPGTYRLDHAQVAGRVRSVMPILAVWLPQGTPGDIVLRVAPVAAAARPDASDCVALRIPLAAGDFLRADQVVAVACDRVEPPALQYDRRSGGLRAAIALSAGTVVRAGPATLRSGVIPGQPITVQTTVGPVTVQRTLTALQASAPGERFFARSDEGEVVAVVFPRSEP